MSVVEDYCDTTFDIVDKNNRDKAKISLDDAVKKQKQLLDGRRTHPKEFDNDDPDFQGGSEESDN